MLSQRYHKEHRPIGGLSAWTVQAGERSHLAAAAHYEPEQRVEQPLHGGVWIDTVLSTPLLTPD